ncbi:MAG: hypothetical protein AAFW64_07345 [Pseudomonadota bacterium]
MTRKSTLAPLLALCLVLSLPMAGWAQGVMARVAGQVVICKAHGPDVVALDWLGQPVELVPTCPECALAAGPMPDVSGQGPAPMDVAVTLERVAPQALAPGMASFRALWPRAPPV